MRRFFTLVELLVVIAIIGILFSMLFPSLSRSKQKARMQVCISNLKQIQISCQLYYDDYSGTTFIYETQIPNWEGIVWTGQIKPYSTSEKFLRCPETTLPDNPTVKIGNLLGSATMGWLNDNFATPAPWYKASYGYNTIMSSKCNYNSAVLYKNIGQISKISETPLVGDGWWKGFGDITNNGLTRYIPTNLADPNSDLTAASGNQLYRFISNRHGKVTAMAFVDGHGVSMPLADVYRQMWYSTYNKNLAVVDLSGP